MQTRNTLRLQNYDYKQNGCYFITLCTKNRYTYFGDIHNDQMQLSKVGEIIRSNWQRIPVHFTFALLDEFVIMPNHLHVYYISARI